MLQLATFSSLLISVFFGCVHGHGRLTEPPSRSSMWRQGYNTPINYWDNVMSCGGWQIQYEENDGKCGICGDRWDRPREHEAGGKYATGTIVRKYDVGEVIDVSVELTANHKGYFVFNLCPTDNPKEKTTEACLEEYPLTIETTGNVQFPIREEIGSTNISFRIQLPEDVKCRACLFRWKYNSGNSWGYGPDGTGCIGCGDQEQFYGCADIAIGYDDVKLGIPAVRPTESVQPSSTATEMSSTLFNNHTENAATGHYFGKTNLHSSTLILLITNTLVVLVCRWINRL